jgi:TRAP-type C4-dicarboxylate transport system permease small subunit
MKLLRKISDVLDSITKYIIAFLLIVMTVVFTAQVVARFIFNSGLYWSEELVRYSCIALIYFASASLFKANDQVAITVLEELLPMKARKYQYIFLTLVNLAYMALVLVIGIQILDVATFQTSPNMQVRMSIVYLLFPISMAIMLFHTVVNLLSRETYRKYDNNPQEKLEEVAK